MPPGVYREATARTQVLIQEGGLSIDNPDCIRQYFDRLYGEADLGEELQKLRSEAKFREVSKEFEMIADNTQTIFVPYNTEARELIKQLDVAGVLYLKLRRGLQRYTVGIYEREFRNAVALGILREVRPGSKLWICPEGFYDPTLGFVTEPTARQLVI